MMYAHEFLEADVTECIIGMDTSFHVNSHKFVNVYKSLSL